MSDVQSVRAEFRTYALKTLHIQKALNLIYLLDRMMSEHSEPHQRDAILHQLLDDYWDVRDVRTRLYRHFAKNPDDMRVEVAKKFFRRMPKEPRFQALGARIARRNFDKAVADPQAKGSHVAARIAYVALDLLGWKEEYDIAAETFRVVFGERVAHGLKPRYNNDPNSTDESKRPHPGQPKRPMLVPTKATQQRVREALDMQLAVNN